MKRMRTFYLVFHFQHKGGQTDKHIVDKKMVYRLHHMTFFVSNSKKKEQKELYSMPNAE
jgi:hypothetical protein